MQSYDTLFGLLKELEGRIARIELQLGVDAEAQASEATAEVRSPGDDTEDSLETRVGENWFARVGIAVFALGVIFLLTLPYEHFPPYVPSLIGYVIVSAMFILSRYWKVSYHHVARYLLGGGMALLFFATLRLFHFGVIPVSSGKGVEFALLAAVVILDFTIAVRQQSTHLFVLSVFLGFLTSLAGTTPVVTFVVITVISILSSALALREKWRWALAPVLLGSYLTHVVASLRGPLFGVLEQQVTIPVVDLGFVLVYAVVFGVADFLSVDREKEDRRLIIDSILNGLVSYGVLFILTISVFKEHVPLWHLLASGIYLAIATFYWKNLGSRYGTFVYAMLGYAALSVAIISLFAVPDVFVWLCWQSILVLTTAVWFRSRFIVVANFVIFLTVYFAYLLLAGTVGVVGISFGIVALLSARILNWKKDRLELRTEMMRNAYLASALFVLPYALYHVLPAGYISISWLGLALFYYLAGRLLHNRKYRWMALLTMSLTIVYVMTVDLVGLDPVIRVISFLVLGSALLTVSMFYSRRSREIHHT